MLSPELEVTIANWILFGKQLRDLTRNLRNGELQFTPEAARILDESVCTFDRFGNDIVDALLVDHRPAVGSVDALRPEGHPRMVHDMPAVYQPDRPIGHLRDMATPAGATNVVQLRPAPKGGAR